MSCAQEQEETAKRGGAGDPLEGPAATVQALRLFTTALSNALGTNSPNRTTQRYCLQPPRCKGARRLGHHEAPARALLGDTGAGTCSPGKKACRESIHVFISCPLNMFTLTYSGGSPSPSLQASRLRSGVGRGREERSPAARQSPRAAWFFLHEGKALLPEAPTEEQQSRRTEAAAQFRALSTDDRPLARRPVSGARHSHGWPPQRPAWQWVQELLSCRKLRSHTCSGHFMCKSAQRKAWGGGDSRWKPPQPPSEWTVRSS